MFIEMDSRAMDSKLLNHKIFKVLKESLSETSNELKNLIECKDDVLYVWNSLENCLLTLNLKLLDDDNADVSYQTLLPTCPPPSVVTRVCAGAARTAVWGARGVCVLELPVRRGRTGGFDGDKETVLCKSFTLDERLFLTQCEVRKVRWHPASASHLIVLVCNNTLRLYNTASTSGTCLVRVVTLGRQPAAPLAGVKLLDGLGHTAVDFAFVPPVPVTGTRELCHSVLVLRGNGDVYMAECNVESASPRPAKFYGPLTMYPSAMDNYGAESCSLAVLGGEGNCGWPGNPPLVLIASCSAVIYHCLLLPDEEKGIEELYDSSYNGEQEVYNQMDQAGYSLYVVEAVEISITLNPEDNRLAYTYPIHLHTEIGKKESYACVHAAGVHTVTVPLIAQLDDYIGAETVELEGALANFCSQPSTAQYLLCTHAPGRIQFHPPQGAAVVGGPALPNLLVVLADGSVVRRPLEPYHLTEQLFNEILLKQNPSLQAEISKFTKEKQKVPFPAIIRQILNRDMSQPLLKISQSVEPTPKECIEFLTKATLKLRLEYLAKQTQARAAIERRTHELRTLRHEQTAWAAELQEERRLAAERGVRLVETCEDARRRQGLINERCSKVLKGIRARVAAAPVEKDFVNELQQYRSQIATFNYNLNKLRIKLEYREQQMKSKEESDKRQEMYLGQSHSDTISSILKQQTAQIKDLIDEVNVLKSKLCIM